MFAGNDGNASIDCLLRYIYALSTKFTRDHGSTAWYRNPVTAFQITQNVLGQRQNSCWSDEDLGVRLNMVGAEFALILIERQEIGCGVC